MKKLFKKIFSSIKNFFNRMSDQEAERIIKYYSQIFEINPDKGDGREKIKTNAFRIRRLCSSQLEKEERKMSKFLTMVLLVGFIALALGLNSLYAGEVDILLQKLVEKGVLTAGEAQQIGTETKEQVKKEIAEGKFSSLPQWIQNTKLKGDLRLRFQNLHEKNAGDISKDTTIGRIRMRLGLDSKVNDKLKVGVGIATGTGDPRSTNITLGGTSGGDSAKPSVYLDYAYAKYEPLPWLNFVGGKMLLSDVLWEPTDLIWDTDITPEGGVIGFNKTLNPKTSVFLKTGALVLVADTSTVSGSMAYLVQPGINYAFNDNLSLKGALTYEYFQTKGSVASTYSKGQNTKIGTSYAYNYSNINPALEFTIKEPFKAFGLNVENLKFFGEYVNNFAVSDKNTGYSLGFQFGNEKIEKWGDWQVRYIYGMLAKDAVLDILPDSDRLSGKTGMRSHEGIISFGLGKNTSLGLDIYRSWSLVGSKAPETLVQFDWNMKF
ncbi:hypothetical protein D4Q80_01575 [bacterium]|nr:MAG: hypothetical protein D4Q80_01575 [bacterium]